MYKYFDIAIIGAGAAGLAAAISSSRVLKKNNGKHSVVIVEKSKMLGKKILVTGNGKCNISNTCITPDFYYGNNPEIINEIIKKVTVKDINKFFNSLGLEIKYDRENRAYPMSGQACSVRDAMLYEIEYLNVSKYCEFDIKYIKKINNDLFEIGSDSEIIRCKKIIVCTGGKSAPYAGYNGDGYKYLSDFGHSITKTFPALVPIKSNDLSLKRLKGVRWTCRVNLLADNTVIKSELGEVQFNENNLSGICIFQISRLASVYIATSKLGNKKYNSVKISLDLFPDYNFKELENMLLERAKKLSHISAENFMMGIINNKLGAELLKKSNILKTKKTAGKIKSSEIRSLAEICKRFEFKVDGVMDWRNSQVTAGGAVLKEFDKDSLESKKVKGLYCAGEILDVDGVCGGYNLHWAWVSGCIAGVGAANSVINRA